MYLSEMFQYSQLGNGNNMEAVQILSVAIPILLGFYSLGKILKVWLKNFEKKIEERYQAKADYDSLLKTIEDIQKALGETATTLDIESQGTLALLRYRLKEEISLAMERGYTSTTEYEVIADMYSAYKALGGNHTLTHMFEDYGDLEIRKGGNS